MNVVFDDGDTAGRARRTEAPARVLFEMFNRPRVACLVSDYRPMRGPTGCAQGSACGWGWLPIRSRSQGNRLILPRPRRPDPYLGESSNSPGCRRVLPKHARSRRKKTR